MRNTRLCLSLLRATGLALGTIYGHPLMTAVSRLLISQATDEDDDQNYIQEALPCSHHALSISKLISLLPPGSGISKKLQLMLRKHQEN